MACNELRKMYKSPFFEQDRYEARLRSLLMDRGLTDTEVEAAKQKGKTDTDTWAKVCCRGKHEVWGTI